MAKTKSRRIRGGGRFLVNIVYPNRTEFALKDTNFSIDDISISSKEDDVTTGILKETKTITGIQLVDERPGRVVNAGELTKVLPKGSPVEIIDIDDGYPSVTIQVLKMPGFSIDEFKKLSQEEITNAPYGWSFNPADASIYRRQSAEDNGRIEMWRSKYSTVVLVQKDTKKEMTLTNTNFGNGISFVMDDVSTKNISDEITTVTARLRGVPYFDKNLFILLGDSIVNGKKELQIIPLEQGLPVTILSPKKDGGMTTAIITVGPPAPKSMMKGGSRRKSKHRRRTRKRKC